MKTITEYLDEIYWTILLFDEALGENGIEYEIVEGILDSNEFELKFSKGYVLTISGSHFDEFSLSKNGDILFGDEESDGESSFAMIIDELKDNLLK
ncbi:MAG: hypothetical protein WC679_01130 [Bacteroidales bacterium]|jgi:hypothetical protein